MSRAWFPRSGGKTDIEPVNSEGKLNPEQIHQLLVAADACELQHKVGVTSPRDGSAKVTTRLLLSGGWVFKTDQARRHDSAAAARQELHPTLELARRLAPHALWHSDKFYFLLHQEPFYWPVSACPRLTTLREVPTPGERFAYWIRMLLLGQRMSNDHEIGLDLNPSNFGYDPAHPERLYYLDDETYPPLQPEDLGASLVSRIPEEPGVSAQEWYEWGGQVQQALLLNWEPDNEAWRFFVNGMQDYLLTRAFEERRAALLAGLTTGHPGLNPVTRRAWTAITPVEQPTTCSTEVKAVLTEERIEKPARLTCVFSDVHGNLPALEAVLRAAQEFGVDSYLFLGDIVGYGPFPRECVRVIRELPNCIRLLGNHDQMVATDEPVEGVNRVARESILWTREQLSSEDRQWLGQGLLEHREANWLAVHGAPVDPMRIHAYVYELTCRDNLSWLTTHKIPICFYGHTHVQFVHRLVGDGRVEQMTPKEIRLSGRDEIQLINPGSVGQPRDGDPAAAFAIWDRHSQLFAFHRVKYPLEGIIAEIHRVGLPADLAVRIEIGR